MRIKARDRRGSVLITVAVFLIVFIMIVAFAVDYGFLLVVRTDLQRAADAAALAAVRDLVPDELGNQDEGAGANARATARDYVNDNLRNDEQLTIPDADIEVGRYDPATINSGTVNLLSDGTLDAVRVTIRRDGSVNEAVSLFFGRVFGAARANVVVSATAALRPSNVLVPGNHILPFAFDINRWDEMGPGDERVLYGDGRVKDANNNEIPGNWGTLDVGDTANSTSDLRDQIREGLRQEDLDSLADQLGPYGEPRIPNNKELPTPFSAQGDTGLSSGMKHALEEVIGEQPRLIPLIDEIAGGGGNNSEYHIVGWGFVEVTDVHLKGQNKRVTIRKIYAYDGQLKPVTDLSITTDLLDGAIGTAGLVE